MGVGDALPVIELVAPVLQLETIDLTSEPEELYQRMRQGFSMPNINNSLVLHHQQWYLNHPDSLRRMVERSSRYLHHIVEEIERRGMPMELALLPMVESAYNPVAYSRSHAAGLWQFVPATGRQYKLEQNWWSDARRDIVASTAAALDYLQYIYDLHGDWHLALASYNWGEGAVGRAINKNRAQGIPCDYLSLAMPEETRNYVPKLQALKNIFSNPNILANLNIQGVPNRPYFTTVTRTSNIDVKLAARLAEMPVQEFVALNPSHNRPIIKSDTPMVIPADKVNTFISNLEALEESEQPLSSWQAYTPRPGETLEQIAPRFGMTVANLKAVNGIKGRLKVSTGNTLLVAGNETADINDVPPVPEAPAAPEPVARLAEPVLARAPEQPRPPVVETTPAVATRTHVVQKGETLPRIAQHYAMTLAELQQINKLHSDRVHPGNKLTVLAPTNKPAAGNQRLASLDSKTVEARIEKVADKPSERASSSAPRAASTHTVVKGETLLKIALHYGLTLSEIRQINKLHADGVIVGTRLTVAMPETESKSARSRSDLAEPESHKAGENRQDRPAKLAKLEKTERLEKAEKPEKAEAKSSRKVQEAHAEPSRAASHKAMKMAKYTIRRGDTLVSIARQFKVEKDDILRWNGISGNAIKPGQTLTIQLVQITL